MAKSSSKNIFNWKIFSLVTVVAVVFSGFVTVNLVQKQTTLLSNAANATLVATEAKLESLPGCILRASGKIRNTFKETQTAFYKLQLYKNAEPAALVIDPAYQKLVLGVGTEKPVKVKNIQNMPRGKYAVKLFLNNGISLTSPKTLHTCTMYKR